MIFLDLVSPDARFGAAPIPHKDEILAYMKRGRIIAVFPGFKTDIFTGERIKGSYTVLSDGVYAWGSDAVYCFEK